MGQKENTWEKFLFTMMSIKPESSPFFKRKVSLRRMLSMNSVVVYPKRMPSFCLITALNPHMFEIGGESYEFFNGQYFKKVMTLKAGASFGEVALQKKCRRTATIKSETATEFAVLTKEVYERTLLLIKEQIEQNMVIFLKTMPAFKDLTYGKVRSYFWQMQ